MADLTITPANVLVKSTATRLATVQFGELVTGGDLVYQNSDGKYWKADNNASAQTATARGVVVLGGAANAFGMIATTGPLDLGAALVIGTPYVVSANAGKIAPASDLLTGNFITHLGYATKTNEINLRIRAEGVALL